MAGKISKCPHVTSVDSVTWEELRTKSKVYIIVLLANQIDKKSLKIPKG